MERINQEVATRGSHGEHAADFIIKDKPLDSGNVLGFNWGEVGSNLDDPVFIGVWPAIVGG